MPLLPRGSLWKLKAKSAERRPADKIPGRGLLNAVFQSESTSFACAGFFIAIHVVACDVTKQTLQGHLSISETCKHRDACYT